MELISLGVRSIFVENMVFAYFLGMCSYLAVSKKVSTAVGLGLAVIFVLTITVPTNWLIKEFILKEGALGWMGGQFASVDLSFLQFIMFIAIIAAMVQLVEMVIEKSISSALRFHWGFFLPLIAVKLRHFGFFTIYGTKRFQLSGICSIRFLFRNRMVPGYYRTCSYQGKT